MIRINSQSGKGGIGYILEQNFGLNLPAKMREAMGYATKDVSDHMHKELKPSEIFEIFKKKFEGVASPFQVTEAHFKQHNGIIAEVNGTAEWCGEGSDRFRKRSSGCSQQRIEKTVPSGV